MAEVETPMSVEEPKCTESKETTTATKGPQSPSKLKAAMKEGKKEESSEKDKTKKEESDVKDTTKKEDEKKDAEEVSKEAVEALNLLAQGKRNMLCGEVPQAVQQLQEACRLLAAKYGDTADECGEAYLSYGTALLDLSRMESGVLGNALDGIDSEDDEKAQSADEDDEKMTEEQKEKLSDDIIDAMTEERETKEKKDGEKTKHDGEADKAKVNGENKDAKLNGEATDGEKKDAEKKDEADKAKTNGEAKINGKDKTPVKNGHSKQNGTSEKPKENGHVEEEDMETENKSPSKKDSSDKSSEATEAESEDIADDEGEASAEEGEGNTEEEGETSADEGKPGTSKEGKDEEEDVSNLQLAWEILELAKVIYTRHDKKEMKLKAADAHLKLGEVCLETEQYETAIEDLTKCLTIQKEYLEPESRLIAETHYQIGLAACFAQKYEQSLENMRKAVEVINNKIKKLEALIEEHDKMDDKDKPSAFDDPIPNAKKEVSDLKEILPDILAKIEDTEDEKRSQEKVKQMVKDNIGGNSEESTSNAFDAPSSSDKTEAAKPVSDISHLVRKKRKPEEDAESTEETTKKAKKEEEPKENGSGDSKKPSEEVKASS